MLKVVQTVKRRNLLIHPHQQQNFNVAQDVKKFGIAVKHVKEPTGKLIKLNAFNNQRKKFKHLSQAR